MIPIDMWDFRLFVRECVKTGKTDEIIKILTEENVIPQGEWIGDEDYASYLGSYEAYKCNKCGYGLHWRDYINSDVPKNFCPNCGADMRGKEE